MMKLWQGGFGDFKTYTVAEDLGQALENIRNKLNMNALPVVAELVDNIEGYTIQAIKESLPFEEVKEEVELTQEEIASAEQNEEDEPNGLIKCKKCGLEFENKGKFLAHTRKCGKE